MQLFINTIFIILRIFSNSFSNVFQKELTNCGENPVVVNFINYILLSIISFPLVFLLHPIENFSQFAIFAILGGITGAICNCFMVLALKDGELSVLGPINSYKAIVGMIFGMLILHEFPNMYGLLGVIFIILGSYFILESPKSLLKKDIQYRIYAAYVFKYINVGYALSLFQLSIIVNVILGYKFFNEKNLTKKLFGSLIILAGSILILLLGH